MAKSFNTLKNRLSEESRINIEERVKNALAEMPLAELRQARKFTQQQIAETLNIKQASVSKMETQIDMYISTIRKYIEAMGGEFLCHSISACRALNSSERCWVDSAKT